MAALTIALVVVVCANRVEWIIAFIPSSVPISMIDLEYNVGSQHAMPCQMKTSVLF